MDEDDIRTVINMYVEAGLRAEQAGFDLLEVSAGDDTLPMQFLEPRFNRRTDRWGGSFENRSRFFIEVLHALKRRLGDPAVRSRLASGRVPPRRGKRSSMRTPSSMRLERPPGRAACPSRSAS